MLWGGGRKGFTSVIRRVAPASFKLIITKKNICAVYTIQWAAKYMKILLRLCGKYYTGDVKGLLQYSSN